MRQSITYIILLTFLAINLSGQIRYFDERYVSTMAQLTPVLVNPGATGWEDTHQVIANYRNKWATFPGSPKSFLVSYDGPIADNLSFGAQFLGDSNGSLNLSKVQGTLAYMLKTADNKLNVGLSGEYAKHGLDDGDANNIQVQQGDVLIDERLAGNGFFDVSVGIYGEYDNTVTYGLVLPALINSRIDDLSPDVDSREFGYIANLGYKYRATNLDASFEPSVFVKSINNVPFHVDINLLGRFAEDKFRGGFTYTVGADNRLGFLVGTTFNSLQLNYGYNLSRNEFQTYNNGSHEIGLRFDIGGIRDKMMDTEMDELVPMEEEIVPAVRKSIERK